MQSSREDQNPHTGEGTTGALSRFCQQQRSSSEWGFLWHDSGCGSDTSFPRNMQIFQAWFSSLPIGSVSYPCIRYTLPVKLGRAGVLCWLAGACGLGGADQCNVGLPLQLMLLLCLRGGFRFTSTRPMPFILQSPCPMPPPPRSPPGSLQGKNALLLETPGLSGT